MRAFLVVIIVFGAMAGCVGADTKPGGVERPTASYDAETGGVEGLVIDPEYQPVEGARVILLGANVTVNTTVEGRFAISGLVPQQYLATVTKAGFKERKQGIEVPIGNVTQVRIVLEPIPPPVPYVDTANTFNGAIRLGYAARAGTVSQNSSGNSGAAFPEVVRTANSGHLRLSGNWQTILFEIDWQPSSDQSDQLALQVTWAERSDNGGTSLTRKEWVIGGDPPLRWRLERTTYDAMQKANPKLLVGLNYGLPFVVTPATDAAQTADVGVYPDQKYTAFVSVGYNGPIPANHTRLAT